MKTERKCTKIRHCSCTWCAGKVKTNSQCRSPCWGWLAVYSLLERTRHALLVCWSKPKRHFTVWFQILRPLSWANKSDTVRLARLRRGVLACLRSAVFKDLKYMISRQSHGFSYNLGKLFPNCTRIRVITYT